MIYEGREVTIVDVDPETEDITFLSDNGWTKTVPAMDIVEDAGETREELDRLILLHQCFSVVVGSIKPTDGPEGSLLAATRKTILEFEASQARTAKGPANLVEALEELKEKEDAFGLKIKGIKVASTKVTVSICTNPLLPQAVFAVMECFVTAGVKSVEWSSPTDGDEVDLVATI